MSEAFAPMRNRRRIPVSRWDWTGVRRRLSWLFCSGAVFFLHPSMGQADGIGSMMLRDAIYLYGKDINSLSYKSLAGFDCDVLQLVLDVESGYTDLAMFEGGGTASDTYLVYPDRIEANHAMFSYALYRGESFKSFDFYDARSSLGDVRIGTATIFGYCYSTLDSARVVFCDDLQSACVTSDGTSIAY
jgi:hypothetical protein